MERTGSLSRKGFGGYKFYLHLYSNTFNIKLIEIFTFWRCRAVNAAVPACRLIIREVAVALGPNLGCCSVRQVEVLGVVDSVWKKKMHVQLQPYLN